VSKINVTNYSYPGCADSSVLTVEAQVLSPSSPLIRKKQPAQKILKSQDRGSGPITISRVEKPIAGPPTKMDRVMGFIPGKLWVPPPPIVLLPKILLEQLLPNAQRSPVIFSGECSSLQINQIYAHIIVQIILS
jgi:hypothetical protein